VLGRHEVDVVTAASLQRQHHVGDFARCRPARVFPGLIPWLMSWFWQKTQRRLQWVKKMVPDPFQPRRQSSSPKWGKALLTAATPGLAGGPPVFEAVHPAVARAGSAVGQRGQRAPDAKVQLALRQ
jgi:hypothetical protein